jgi:transcriptional regulator
MYKPPHFRENNRDVWLQFVRDFPFAFLSGCDASGIPVVTQVPILIEEKNGEIYLQGHIMRNTDHYKAFIENPQALAVFTSPNTYVSASWYSNPSMGSTWNYMSVHVRGTLRFLSDEELKAFMKKMTLHFEKGRSDSPTVFDNLPDEYVQKMLPAIAGFEIRADAIENVFKLSQNRDEQSYLNIISRLESQGGNSAWIAQEMRTRLEELFPESNRGK